MDTIFISLISLVCVCFVTGCACNICCRSNLHDRPEQEEEKNNEISL